jgi:hypothetical protein
MSNMQIPIIERRRIEAELAKLMFNALSERYGQAEATEILTDVIRKSAIAQGQQFAKSEPGGTTLESFIKLYDLWTMNGALEISVTRRDGTHFDFNVVRCKYAEMYREMGLGKIGHILSCNRDGTFCQGYDPKIKLKRTQTLMEGASHCDFRYSYDSSENAASDSAPAINSAKAAGDKK